MENVAAALQVSSEAGRELADALCNRSEASGTHCWAPTPCTDTAAMALFLHEAKEEKKIKVACTSSTKHTQGSK